MELSDLIARLYALHQRDERAFNKLTDAELEKLADESNVKSFFGGDAWNLVALEVGKRTGISERRLADFAGMLNLGAVEGVEDVAALVANLGDDFKANLLAKLGEQFPAVVKELGVEVPPETSGPRPAPDEWLTLDEAGKWLPGNPSHSTLWRWCTKGVNGVFLKPGRFGGTIFITLAAVDRFGLEAAEVGRRQPISDNPTESGERASARSSKPKKNRSLETAQRVLETAGIRPTLEA